MNNKFKYFSLCFSIFVLGFIFFCFSFEAFAQSGLEGRINVTISNLVRIINILIVGFVAWSGFLIAKGEGSGVSRLIYGIVGLVVVNSAYMIINFFN
ncbi:MAG: hypothetical protein H6625_00735 [Bdellovibrionaceae bacterium]|nr:hypothetical protein [Pseudobdellovibrionaceae bacterium]